MNKENYTNLLAMVDEIRVLEKSANNSQRTFIFFIMRAIVVLLDEALKSLRKKF